LKNSFGSIMRILALMSVNSDDGAVLDDVFEDVESLPQVDTAFGRGSDQDRIERGAPRPVSPRETVFNEVAHCERKVAGVEDHARDGRCPLRDALEQGPVTQTTGTMTVDEVPVRDVAGEACAIDEQYLRAVAARSIASGAPAHRAPTTITSGISIFS
jgi:hypothetical protein